MHLEVHRTIFSDKATIGTLFINGNLECVTLEDRVREPGVKVQNETAIPVGIYKIILNESPKFGKIMPRLLDVPMFDGILIHSGNTDLNTHGCILVGEQIINNDYIQGGSTAFPRIFQKLQQASENDESIDITITNDADIYVD